MMETHDWTKPRYWTTPWHALRVTGPDRKGWLNGIVTCNTEATSAELTCWGSLLNKQGKIQADLHIFDGSDGLYVVVAGAQLHSVREALDGYLVMEDAEIEPCDLNWVVRFGGSGSNEEDVRAVQRTHFSPLGDTAQLIGLVVEEVEQLQRAHPESFYSDEEWLDARVAAAFPEWGKEYGGADNLHAAGLERRTVDWSKGCYLGQEVVCMQEMRGKVKRRLVYFRCVGGDLSGLSLADAELRREDTAVGRIVCTGKNAGFARVESPHYAPGTLLSITRDEGEDLVVAVAEGT